MIKSNIFCICDGDADHDLTSKCRYFAAGACSRISDIKAVVDSGSVEETVTLSRDNAIPSVQGQIEIDTCCVACNTDGFHMKMGPVIQLEARIEWGTEVMVVKPQGTEGISHWIMKVIMIQDLLKRGYCVKDIYIEERIEGYIADVFARKKNTAEKKEVWIECGNCSQDKIGSITSWFSGVFISVINVDDFFYRLRRMEAEERSKRDKIDWREIHRKIVFPKTTTLVVSAAPTPKIGFGISRDENDKFTFIKGSYNINSLHPRKMDKSLFFSEYDL